MSLRTISAMFALAAPTLLFPLVSAGQAAPDGLTVLDKQGWEHLRHSTSPYANYSALQLTFLALRDRPSLLDDKAVLQFFIRMNNVDTPNFQKVGLLVKSEFDFPMLAAYYRQKAPEILAATPTEVIVQTEAVSISVNGGNPQNDSADVGSYDLNAHVFPWVDSLGNPATCLIDHMSVSDGYSDARLGPFIFAFPIVKISQISVDPDTARALTLIGGNGAGNGGNGKTRRRVMIAADIDIPPGSLSAVNPDGAVLFNSKLLHMVVTTVAGNHLLATIVP